MDSLKTKQKKKNKNKNKILHKKKGLQFTLLLSQVTSIYRSY